MKQSVNEKTSQLENKIDNMVPEILFVLEQMRAFEKEADSEFKQLMARLLIIEDMRHDKDHKIFQRAFSKGQQIGYMVDGGQLGGAVEKIIKKLENLPF